MAAWRVWRAANTKLPLKTTPLVSISFLTLNSPLYLKPYENPQINEMAYSLARLLKLRSVTASSFRCFSTVTETVKTVAPKEKADTLYSRLSAVRDPRVNITVALDDWVAEGKFVKRFDVASYINLLRKIKKYNRALQVI